MLVNEFILDLYKKGCTPKYISNLLHKKLKKKGCSETQKSVLNMVEKTILEFYTTKGRSPL